MRYFAALLLLSLLIVPRVCFAGGGSSYGYQGWSHSEYCARHPYDYRYCGQRYRDSDHDWLRAYPRGYADDDWRRAHEHQGKHYQKQGDSHGQPAHNEQHGQNGHSEVDHDSHHQ